MNYETGVREISINSLIALSVYYNVSIDEIVGNPFSLRTSKKLSFSAFIYNNGILTETIPQYISTANNDVIVVTHDDLNIEFFWKTQTNSVNHDMLFLYYDIPYISKVFFDQQGGGFFFINGEMVYFEKDKVEEIIFLGVSMGRLKKDFTIPYFF